MAYPTFTTADLSVYSGRAETSYRPFTEEAIRQATLLFKLATRLTDFPADPEDAELARYAILAMADYIVLQQPHAKVAASPFTSESLGSYSYSKQAGAVRRGEETGVMWFDMAVQRLAVESDDDNVAFGSIGVFERDIELAGGGEKTWVRGPRDLNQGAALAFWRTPNPER